MNNFENFILNKVRTQDEREIFKNTWLQIWIEEGYSSDNKILNHYDQYDNQSCDFYLLSKSDSIGTIRIILPGKKIFPVLKDFDIAENERNLNNKNCEVTLLTLKSDFQNNSVSINLISEGIRTIGYNNIDNVYIASDERLWKLLKYIGLHFKQIGPTKFYEGSNTIPGILSTRFQYQKTFEKFKLGKKLNGAEKEILRLW